MVSIIINQLEQAMINFYIVELNLKTQTGVTD